MAAATAGLFTPSGCAGNLAEQIAVVINTTQDPALLMGLGMNAFLATEIVRQVDDSTTGNVPKLMGLGCPAALAGAIGDAIDDI